MAYGPVAMICHDNMGASRALHSLTMPHVTGFLPPAVHDGADEESVELSSSEAGGYAWLSLMPWWEYQQQPA